MHVPTNSASRRMLTHSNALVRVHRITGRCPWAQLGCACLVAGHDAWRCRCRDLGAHPNTIWRKRFGRVFKIRTREGEVVTLDDQMFHPFGLFHRFSARTGTSLTPLTHPRTRWCAWSFALFSHTADMRWPHGKIHFTDVDPRHPPAHHPQFVAFGYNTFCNWRLHPRKLLGRVMCPAPPTVTCLMWGVGAGAEGVDFAVMFATCARDIFANPHRRPLRAHLCLHASTPLNIMPLDSNFTAHPIVWHIDHCTKVTHPVRVARGGPHDTKYPLA
jgi:hypothetical protein